MEYLVRFCDGFILSIIFFAGYVWDSLAILDKGTMHVFFSRV